MLDDTRLDQPDGRRQGGCPDGRRELPASMAAAVLMTMDYAGSVWPGDRCAVVGRLPPRHCHFDGTLWHEDWSGTDHAIRVTPIGGAPVCFVRPSGYHESFDAIMLLARELRPEVRRVILSVHPTLALGPVVADDVAAACLGGLQGRYSAFVAEVWEELRAAASTAHGRLALITELEMTVQRR